MPSVSIHGDPIHSNITQYIVYDISKLCLLKSWDYCNLTHTEEWDEIELTLFKLAQETTTIHMAHFITKCTSNNLPNMTILQRQLHAKTNLCLWCGINTETIQHHYKCTHKGIRNRWTASVDALKKRLEYRNTDPDIAIVLAIAPLYIAGERNDLPQCLNLTLN